MRTASAAQLNGARRVFFEMVFNKISGQYAGIAYPTLPRRQSWCAFARGPFGYYSVLFSDVGYRVEVKLDTKKYESTKNLFDALHDRAEHFERRLGFGLTWLRNDEIRSCRIYTLYGRLDPRYVDAGTRARAASWGAERAIALHRVFDSDLRRLAAT